MKTYPSIRICSQSIIAATFIMIPSDCWTQMHADHLFWSINEFDLSITWSWNRNNFTGFQISHTFRLRWRPIRNRLASNSLKTSQSKKIKATLASTWSLPDLFLFYGRYRSGRLKMFVRWLIYKQDNLIIQGQFNSKLFRIYIKKNTR